MMDDARCGALPLVSRVHDPAVRPAALPGPRRERGMTPRDAASGMLSQ
jgi:hypothetical protein